MAKENSGGCEFFGLTSERLFAPHGLRHQNRLIAGDLYLKSIIERWGRGDDQDGGVDGICWPNISRNPSGY